MTTHLFDDQAKSLVRGHNDQALLHSYFNLWYMALLSSTQLMLLASYALVKPDWSAKTKLTYMNGYADFDHIDRIRHSSLKVCYQG